MESILDGEIKTLSDELIKEIFKAVGLSPDGWARRAFGSFFSKATDRLASIGVSFDRQVALEGFCKAAQSILPQFVHGVKVRGADNIPPDGPLLVVSNHPGAYDALVISSFLGRNDIKIVISDIPFLMKLPCASNHFIRATLDPYVRMQVIRQSIRHLSYGGALLIFPSGHIDPDPAVWDNAEKSLLEWSPSVEIFLRKVPQAQVLISIVSGVLAADWAHSPITWLRKEGLDRRRLAEFGQVIQQLLFPGQRLLSPSISFADPLYIQKLMEDLTSSDLLQSLINRAQSLFADHAKWALAPQSPLPQVIQK